MTKIAEHVVTEIRRALAAGEMRKDIARRLGINLKTVTLHGKGVEKPEMRGIHNSRHGWVAPNLMEDFDSYES